mgnify:CR=1 FL=1|tara:strand:+ start:1705 stop:2487 length:783 start_codon:yes stop_codon:yes gene_type:complete
MDLMTCQDVSYKISNSFINKDITLTVKNKDLISVIGPNGSGKSTMIKLLSGELAPTNGEITLKNKKLSDWNIKDLACIRSVLSQSSTLSFPFSVYDIISMGRYPFSSIDNIHQRFERDIIDELLNYFDLLNLKNRNYLTLSGGEKQRVQLARVFAQIWSEDYNGKFILLDEPISFLDIYHQIKLYELIYDLNNKGLTIIMVMHDINHALQYAQKVIMMKKAQLVFFGKVNDVINQDNLKEIFDVDYKMNSYNPQFLSNCD